MFWGKKKAVSVELLLLIPLCIHEIQGVANEISFPHIKQSGPVFYNGVEFDDNIAVNNDYGQW